MAIKQSLYCGFGTGNMESQVGHQLSGIVGIYTTNSYIYIWHASFHAMEKGIQSHDCERWSPMLCKH